MNESYQTCHEQTRRHTTSTPIHTTLFDLIDALDTEAGPDAIDVVTDIVTHLFNTYRVSCVGDFEGYRMVVDEENTSYSAVA